MWPIREMVLMNQRNARRYGVVIEQSTWSSFVTTVLLTMQVSISIPYFGGKKGPEAGLPAPDAVVLLDLTVEEASKRGSYGEERYKS
jgi:hypothetical protein